MPATLKEVAEYAGVSPSTVSRVVRGVPAVSKSAQVRVLRAIDALGYRPNTAARTIRTGVSHAIGYVVPDISNWFYSVVFRGAQNVLRANGYELVLGTSDGNHDLQTRTIEAFIGRNIDGLILSLIDEDWKGIPDDVPTVLLDRDLDLSQFPAGARTPNTALVLSDHAAGMRDAVSYLHDLGHRRIALLTGRSDIYSTRIRREAFRERARELGIPEEDIIERTGNRSVEAGERHTEELLGLPVRPTAIIAGSNQLLHGTLQAFARLGIDCPKDITLVACEDSDICRLYRPPVTVVRRDLLRMGEVAAELLLERLAQSRGLTDEVLEAGDARKEGPEAADGGSSSATGASVGEGSDFGPGVELAVGRDASLSEGGDVLAASGRAMPPRRVLPTELIVRGSSGPVPR